MTMAWSKDDLRANREWVRAYYAEHPGASVDEAAKAANNAHRSLHRGDIRDIRAQMQREQAEREREVLEHTVKPKPPLVRRPLAVLPPELPKVDVPPEPPEPPPAEAPPPASPEPRPPPPPPPAATAKPATAQADGRGRTIADFEVRRSWLADHLLEHPALGTKAALDAVRTQFGVGLDLTLVCEMVRDVRVAAGLPLLNGRYPRKPGSKPPGRPKLQAVPRKRSRPRKPKAVATPPATIAPNVETDIEQALVVIGRVMAARGRSQMLVTLRGDGSVDCEPVEPPPQAITVRKGKVRL